MLAFAAKNLSEHDKKEFSATAAKGGNIGRATLAYRKKITELLWDLGMIFNGVVKTAWTWARRFFYHSPRVHELAQLPKKVSLLEMDHYLIKLGFWPDMYNST